MVKATVREIDDQVKAYEAARKEEKLRAIQEQYRAMIGDLAELAPYERLHNPRWLNATAGMGAICQELGNKIDRITAGLTAIDGLQLPPELAGQLRPYSCGTLIWRRLWPKRTGCSGSRRNWPGTRQ